MSTVVGMAGTLRLIAINTSEISLLTFCVSAKIEFHKYLCDNKRILFYEWVPTLDELRTEKTRTTVKKSCTSCFYQFFSRLFKYFNDKSITF